MAKVAHAESVFLENARELVPKLWERAPETERSDEYLRRQ